MADTAFDCLRRRDSRPCDLILRLPKQPQAAPGIAIRRAILHAGLALQGSDRITGETYGATRGSSL